MSTQTNIFEQASRLKIRFATGRGTISTEDLWDLKLEDLDTIAKSLYKSVKEGGEESFIKKRTTVNEKLELGFELVKHVIDAKLEEADKKKLAKERAEKRAQLIELIGKKEITALEGKSIEELKAELAGLD